MPHSLTADYYNREISYQEINEEILIKIRQAIKVLTILRDAHNDPACKHKKSVNKDIELLNSIKKINIPTAIDYYQIDLKTSGVTEKLSLISSEALEQRLHKIIETKFDTIDDYLKIRKSMQLIPDAIIKLPKHEEIVEVIREAIALFLSASLGLKTTASILVSYYNQPALFVPFENIKLLTDVAEGQHITKASASLSKWTGWGVFASAVSNNTPQEETYQHYATLNPVGEGIQSDCFIEDFSIALLLMYLCNDPDTIGKDNQNKGLFQDWLLYVFDQSFHTEEKFDLDTRLSLKPIGLKRHSRHNIGRNRTLLEDSALDKKCQNFLHAEPHVTQVIAELETIIKTFNIKCQETTDDKLKTDLSTLKTDIQLLKETLQKRLNKIKTVFPKSNIELNEKQMTALLILEKLMNQPAIFNEQGRPYKNPWTEKHSMVIKSVNQIEANSFEIEFSSGLNKNQVAFINRYLKNAKIETLASGKLKIKNTTLETLSETILYPECNYQLDMAFNYLDLSDLKQIANAYDSTSAKTVLALINNYLDKLSSQKITIQDMLNTINALKKQRDELEKKGFVSHVLKRFCFAMQQQLRLQINDQMLLSTIDTAFNAALKLDRLISFNTVLATAITNGKLQLADFKGFLNHCIETCKNKLNYQQALECSLLLEEQAKNIGQHFNTIDEADDNWFISDYAP
jgi:hypothetical protein